MYIIAGCEPCDSNKKVYIKRDNNNSFSVTTYKSQAYVFEDIKKANNFLINFPNIFKHKYKDWKYVSINVDNKIIVDHIVEQNNPVDSSISHYKFTDFDELINSINELSSRINHLYDNKDFLSHELSVTDKQIDEVMHFIEFENFSASFGYKLSLLLKLLRKYRRKLKNEFELIKSFNVHTCNNIARGNTTNAVAGLLNRKYTPEYMSDLFESRNIDFYINLYKMTLDKII